MSLKMEFVERASKPGANISALCREFGVSRETGHKWLRRARDDYFTQSFRFTPEQTAFLKEGAALERSTSEFVFSGPTGKMRSEEADPQKVLRHAMGRAGLVEGYEQISRRCKAAARLPCAERHPDARLRTCRTCGMKLWLRAIPRPMRFHDLRHSAATLRLRAGVDIHRVQRILRHRDVKLTTGTYAHLLVEDLRAAVEALPASTDPPKSREFEFATALVARWWVSWKQKRHSPGRSRLRFGCRRQTRTGGPKLCPRAA